VRAFAYAADLWCEDCGRAIRARLDAAGRRPGGPGSRLREQDFDSDEYPKGPYGEGGGEADSPAHCAAGEECVGAVDLGCPGEDAHGRSTTILVGAPLGNPLTAEGEAYVLAAHREALAGGDRRQRAVTEHWLREYGLKPAVDAKPSPAQGGRRGPDGRFR
jgi:hypothetical protein